MLSQLRAAFLFILLLVCQHAFAQRYVNEPVARDTILCDSLRVSLVTCYPGDEVYQLFGHTAIRVRYRCGNDSFDLAYNYGMFNFASGNFVFKFTIGATDYMLGVYDFDVFMADYYERGSKVVEQELNLTPQEKALLYKALYINSLPQNRVYRYNFLYDNCATRPRDMINAATGGCVRYGEPREYPSFRTMIHRYADNYSWFMFGVDLALGCELDRRATYAEQMFVPMILEEAYSGAVIVQSNDSVTVSRPLVSRERVVYDPHSSPVLPPTPWYLSPLFAALVLLLVAVVVTYVDMQYRRVTHWFDTLFYGLCFLGSVVVYFLIIFSMHPATDVNYNALWLTPLSLIAAVCPYGRRLQGFTALYHCVNIVAIALFVVTVVARLQHYNAAFYPLIAVSLLRSLNFIIIYKASRRTYKPSSLHRNE